MREISFRGKRIDNGEWIYGDLLQNIDAVKIREKEKSIQAIAKSFTVDPETVGEYTGLTDANGKKIFEGDIIQYQPDNALAPLRSFVVYDASVQKSMRRNGTKRRVSALKKPKIF